MLPIGLNHMTVPRASARKLLDVAATLGCTGVELRNDLGRPIFEGEPATRFGDAAAEKGIEIFGLAEVKAFNHNTAQKSDMAEALIMTAAACGAQAVALIPMVTDDDVPRSEQRAALRKALHILQPLCEEHVIKGLIEPLGFAKSSLRFKEDVVAVLDELHRPSCFAIVHDTFHHHLAGEATFYADLTAIVHISGLCNPTLAVDQMTDAHRVLVDHTDRLGNITQLRALRDAGYTGPASFEAFAPEIHDMKDPIAALAGSIAFITSHLSEVSAGAA